jgi:SAM-dependent methyltransferase
VSGSVHETAAEGFGAVADEYERARPDYPHAAVERLLRELGGGEVPGRRRWLDLGAGTGKLTRMLTGERVVAAEPLASMRAHFARVLPDVPLLAAVAERLPFTASSFGGVVCAQAFHWFDGEPALREIHRILEPGGRVALIWNQRDETVPWARELGDILRPYQERVPQENTGEWRRGFEATTELFGPLREALFPHAQPLDAPGLVERYASASYVAVLPEPERLDVLDRIRALAETHPDLVGRDSFELPYVTELHWCERR